MSKIDQQIQELQLRKKKIEYIAYIKDLLVNDQSCIDFKEVQDEVLKGIIPALDLLKSSFEEDTPVEFNLEGSFTVKELEALKLMASKVLNKKTQEQTRNSTPPANGQNNVFSKEESLNKKTEELSHTDKLSFALNHRHLANQFATGQTDDGKNVSGIVVGLDAPYVYLKPEVGPTSRVHINNLGA